MEKISQNLTQSQGELGNTKPIPLGRCRRWCLTLNNWTPSDYALLENIGAQYLIIGKEIGKKCKTPHLQCYLEFKNQKSFSSLKKTIPKAHLSKAKGSRQDNIKYCSKDGDYKSTFPLDQNNMKLMLIKKYYSKTIWRPWQQKILNILDQEPDSRTIHWICDYKGNNGKSFLTKYIYCKYENIIICNGKKENIFNLVKTFIDQNGGSPGTIICDIPRSCINYISYTALEKLKDGLFYSGKYEGGICCFDHPRVICFANERPNEEAMSSDRWNILTI